MRKCSPTFHLCCLQLLDPWSGAKRPPLLLLGSGSPAMDFPRTPCRIATSTETNYPQTPRRLNTSLESDFPRTPLRRTSTVASDFPRTPLRRTSAREFDFPGTPRTPRRRGAAGEVDFPQTPRRRRPPTQQPQPKPTSSALPHRLVVLLNDHFKTRDDLSKAPSLKSEINGECNSLEKSTGELKEKVYLACSELISRSEEFGRIVDCFGLMLPESQGLFLWRFNLSSSTVHLSFVVHHLICLVILFELDELIL